MSTSAAPAQTIAVTNPHRTDFHQADVPKPMDVSGSFSHQVMIESSTAALAKMSISRAVTRDVPGVRLIARNTCRISSMPNREMKSPIQVAEAGRLLAAIGSLGMGFNTSGTACLFRQNFLIVGIPSAARNPCSRKSIEGVGVLRLLWPLASERPHPLSMTALAAEVKSNRVAFQPLRRRYWSDNHEN